MSALLDLQIVLPGVTLQETNIASVPYVCSSVHWVNGRLITAQPYGPMRSANDACLDEHRARAFIRSTVKSLRTALTQESQASLDERIAERTVAEPFPKMIPLPTKMLSQGPSIITALDWIGPACHVKATIAFFSGEFFLGRYAANYFAKQLLPASARHLTSLQTRGIEAKRVCLYCWHNHRQAELEDEAHVILECPHYDSQRRDFIGEISEGLASSLQSAVISDKKIEFLYGAATSKDWQAFGRLLARIRQVRRRMRKSVQKTCELLDKQEFHNVKRTWQKSGKHVCRHGVFFRQHPQSYCPCMSDDDDADWQHAVLMPALNGSLKCVVTDTFARHTYQRLGVLQAEARRRNYI
jgi:hypothetical protein